MTARRASRRPGLSSNWTRPWDLIIGVWIDIHRPNNWRSRNAIAFGSHALRINRVISRLQRATSGASIPTSHSTARD
jgi:hypothetical protein